MAYIFLNMLQSLYVGFVGNFHQKYASIYYTFQPLSYLAVMTIKFSLYFFNFKRRTDVKSESKPQNSPKNSTFFLKKAYNFQKDSMLISDR